MKEIILTQGKVALVDDEDFEKVTQFKWCAVRDRKTWYAVRRIGRGLMRMHQFISGISGADHKNHNGLDNQRDNLRSATHSQNCANRTKSSRKTYSRFRGVSRAKNRWVAQITVAGQNHYIGRFISESEAAAAYDSAARKHFGRFATLNCYR